MTRALLAIALLVPLVGCSLERPDPDKSFYALTPPVLEAGGSTSDVTVRVARARVAAPFGSRSLQYRVGPSQYQADYYENWADDPGSLVAAAVVAALSSTKAFGAVVDDASVAGDASTLELYVTALYADVTERGAPTAVLGIQATLLAPGGRVVYSRAFDRTAPADDRRAASMVAAWNASLAEIARELAMDVKGAT
ncbi:MAG: ABC-type transport auxiliary lipoprotein family protein [Planctomycetota bacterium]